MAHYAFLDGNNIVTNVIVGRDETNMDWEMYYGMKQGQVCKRTSYNTIGGVHNQGGTPFRKNYAGVGYKYDAERDAFIPPQPYESWTLDEESCLWKPPVELPTDGKQYLWDENTVSWINVDE